MMYIYIYTYQDVNRISLRMDNQAKDIDDSAAFDSSIATLFYKDLGPQIGYRTVLYVDRGCRLTD